MDLEQTIGLLLLSLTLLLLIRGGLIHFASFLLFLQKKLGFPRNVRTGSEYLIGRRAVVSKDFCEQGAVSCGLVQIQGELWRAECESAQLLQRGESVSIQSVIGLTVQVAPVLK